MIIAVATFTILSYFTLQNVIHIQIYIIHNKMN